MSFIKFGLMLESERKIFELMDQRTPMSKYWMPLVWATNIINRARKESIITSDHIVQTLLMELSDMRRRLGALIGYDTVNVPLVYTQVVSLALYVYFMAALLGRQFIPYADSSMQNKWENPDMYFPFFTALQFCFYIGWLKVAEVLINPFGEDDDDIELNWLIDRHIKASYMIVDEMHEEHPELLKDQFWDEVVPKELPYTVASEHYRKEEPKCSADSYKPKAQDAMYANIVGPKKSLLHEDMYADYESVDTPIVERRKSTNWFTRQISRTGMGSIRSSSTAYSSGGLFGRHRGNSVYVNPENGQVGMAGLQSGTHHQKMSIYDKLVGRRSGRSRNFKNSSKLNGASAIPVKSRPRIPTPDVTKEVVDRENRLAASVAHVQSQISPGLTLMPHQLAAGYGSYPDGDVPVVQVVLSPIQELDGSSSVNNTLHAGQPGTAALAQAILSPGLGPVLATPVSVPMTASQLTSLGLTTSQRNSPMIDHQRVPSFLQAFNQEKISASQPLTLTELHAEEDPPSSRSSNGSSDGKDSFISTLSNTTASVTSRKSPDNVPPDAQDQESFHLVESTPSPSMSLSLDVGQAGPGLMTFSSELSPTAPRDKNGVELSSPKSLGAETERKISAAEPPSALTSLSSINSENDRIRKISAMSGGGNNSPKREIYV
ncbi:unnamed protein product [Acanthoscelides obtectus]|uniref:Bestrophin homolog n=1 Tax=Acanthoscelides obtectus TaxID=200917 RepID=A0A9P0LQR4_ACAOB|nr:unnamed protein product [Acanthoscelides obtectus]CAK1644929.1 Bestrophin-3 [Acanthoscelides obtectus]